MREISTASLESFWCFCSEIYFSACARWIIERTSPQDPFAIKRNCLNSLLLRRSYPSAMLLVIETDALQIWSRKLKSLDVLNSLYMAMVNSIAFYQAIMSSKRAICILPVLYFQLLAFNLKLFVPVLADWIKTFCPDDLTHFFKGAVISNAKLFSIGIIITIAAWGST